MVRATVARGRRVQTRLFRRRQGKAHPLRPLLDDQPLFRANIVLALHAVRPIRAAQHHRYPLALAAVPVPHHLEALRFPARLSLAVPVHRHPVQHRLLQPDSKVRPHGLLHRFFQIREAQADRRPRGRQRPILESRSPGLRPLLASKCLRLDARPLQLLLPAVLRAARARPSRVLRLAGLPQAAFENRKGLPLPTRRRQVVQRVPQRTPTVLPHLLRSVRPDHPSKQHRPPVFLGTRSIDRTRLPHLAWVAMDRK